MPIISARVRYIFKHFYADKARRRFDEIVQFTNHFLHSLPFTEEMHVQVDKVKMLALVESYFLDVIRFKEYHFDPKSDSEINELSHNWMEAVHHHKKISPTKVAAFTAKWILNYKPVIIYPLKDDNLTQNDIANINSASAQLALNFSLSLIGIDHSFVNRKLAESIMYHFRYRVYDDRSFFLIFDSILLSSTIDNSSQSASEYSAASNPVSPPTQQEEPKMTRRYAAKSYSIFLAGAEDCDKLRNAATEVIDQINVSIKGGIIKLNLFDWRTDKGAGHMGGQFQEKIFDDAAEKWGKPECDILILLLWHRFGQNTAKEYEFYIESARANKKIIPRLLCCHFCMPVSPLDQKESNTAGLWSWIESKHSDWAEISPERGQIKTYNAYKSQLRKRLDEFLDEPDV